MSYSIIKADVTMKRNMDLIRDILLKVESDEHGFYRDNLNIEGYTQEEIGYHIVLLGEAGLAHVAEVTAHGDKSPAGIITRLTWDGHEFLDAARDRKIWNKAKDQIGKTLASAGFQVLMLVLNNLAKQQLGLS